jgi:hypothetical protein
VLKPRRYGGTEVLHSRFAVVTKSLECVRFSAALIRPASAGQTKGTAPFSIDHRRHITDLFSEAQGSRLKKSRSARALPREWVARHGMPSPARAKENSLGQVRRRRSKPQVTCYEGKQAP